MGVIHVAIMSYIKKQRIYPIYKDGRFYNFEGEHKAGFFIPSLYMMLKSNIQRRKERTDITSWIHNDRQPINRCQDLHITWIGHSTFLIQIGGLNILTDPVFDDLSLFFPRAAAPGIAIHELPPIDIVIISHNHRDHMDAKALMYLKNHPKITFLVPQADKAWFVKRGFERVYELTWWERQYFSSPQDSNTRIELSFLPALHWSQRGIRDYNKSLWGSWMISCGDTRVYFAGDTAYWHHFKAIADEFDHIDIALMPIGPCEPRGWMKHSHISAEEAVTAFKELNARHFIPMHWGTYYFGIDDFIMPIERLHQHWKEHSLDEQFLHALKFGQRLRFNRQLEQQLCPILPNQIML